MTIALRAARVARVLAVIVTLLTVATYVAQLMKWQDVGGRVARFIDSDQKSNFPTGFKILALVTAAVLLWVIGRASRASGDRRASRWQLFAVVVAFLAVDETTSLHQSIGDYTRDRADTSGVLHYSWVLLYLPAALLVIAYLWPLFRELGRSTQVGLAAAGLFFIGGAGVSALVKGDVVADEGLESLSFYLVAATSDVLEMIGLAILVVVAMREVEARVGDLQLEFR